eukprot:scaffold21781_cov79-Skeletonema_marinoi.AAC.2
MESYSLGSKTLEQDFISENAEGDMTERRDDNDMRKTVCAWGTARRARLTQRPCLLAQCWWGVRLDLALLLALQAGGLLKPSGTGLCRPVLA